MNITNKVLEELGAVPNGENTYSLFGYEIIWNQGQTWLFKKDPGGGHIITKVEEMILCAASDGYFRGRQEIKNDLKNFFY